MEIDNSQDLEAQPSSVCVMTENIPKTKELPQDSNEVDVKMTCIKVPESADNTNSCPTASRSRKDTKRHLHLSKSRTNTQCVHPDSTETHSKAEITPRTTMGSLNRTTTSKVVGTGQTAATSDSTSAKSKAAVSKLTSKTSSSNPDPTNLKARASKLAASTPSCIITTSLGETANKCTAAISRSPTTTTTTSKVTGPTSTSIATISNATSSTKSVMASRPTDPRTETASKVTATSHKAAPTPHAGSTVRHEATSRAPLASKIADCSENSVTASQPVVSSAKKKSIKCNSTEASMNAVHMKNSVGSNANVAPPICKSNPPAAPHGTIPISEHKNPPTVPLHTSVSKTMSTESRHKIGVNQLIAVSCEGRQQVYCQVCPDRLKQSSHVRSFNHHYNYVKMKFPTWSVGPSEFKDKLDEIVAHLAEVEKGVGARDFQKLQVTNDIYNELAALPVKEAVEKLKALKQGDVQVPSSSSDDTAEASEQHVGFASPYESSSPEDGMHMPHNEMPVIKQENFEPDVEAQVTPAIESPVKPDKLHISADPLATESDSTSTHHPTAPAQQETPEKRQQQDKSEGTQKELEATQGKSSPAGSVSDDVAAASLYTKEQNPSIPSQKTEHVMKSSGSGPRPEQNRAYRIGDSTQGSNLSKYMVVKGQDSEPVIGRGCVWECQGNSLMTFYLCECCSERVSSLDMHQHMVSHEHQYNYIQREYPHFLSLFWAVDYLSPEIKMETFDEVAQMLSAREPWSKIDVQWIRLGDELHECIRTAPVSEALSMLQKLKEENQRNSLSIRALQQKDKQPEDRQSREESFQRKTQPAPASELDKSSDNARQKTKKHKLKEAATVGELDGIKQERVRPPPDVSSIPAKASSVDPPYPVANTYLSPQETCRNPSIQTALRSPIDQQQNPISQPDTYVKQTEVLSESSSSSTVCPKTSPSLSLTPKEEHPTAWTVASVETLASINIPKLQDPLGAKFTESSQSVSESTSVNPAATLTSLSPDDQDTGPGSDRQDPIEMAWMESLTALVKVERSKMISSCKSAPDCAESNTSYTTIFSKDVDSRWDSKCEQAGSQMAKHKTRWDSKIQVVNDTVNKCPSTTNSLERTFSAAAPLVLGYENQQVNPNANHGLSDINSSLAGFLTRSDTLFRVTEGQAASTMLPTTGIANSTDLQQGSVTAHNILGYVSPTTPTLAYGHVATNHSSSQIPQPQDKTETDNNKVCELPIKTIATVIPDPTNQQFMSSFNKQDPAEVQGGYLSSGTPFLQYGSLYQSEGYPAGLYPRQIYFDQQRNVVSLPSFGHSLATPVPPGYVSLQRPQQNQQLGLQQHQLIMQQQQQHQNQILLQQQMMQQQQQQQQQIPSQQQQQQQQIPPQQQQQQQMMQQQQIPPQQQQQILLQQQMMQQQQQQQIPSKQQQQILLQQQMMQQQQQIPSKQQQQILLQQQMMQQQQQIPSQQQQIPSQQQQIPSQQQQILLQQQMMQQQQIPPQQQQQILLQKQMMQQQQIPSKQQQQILLQQQMMQQQQQQQQIPLQQQQQQQQILLQQQIPSQQQQQQQIPSQQQQQQQQILLQQQIPSQQIQQQQQQYYSLTGAALTGWSGDWRSI